MTGPENGVLRGKHILPLKSCLLALWAAWLSVVWTTNVLDGVKSLGLLPESWPLASGNFHFLTETTARYGTPAWLNGLLFVGVIIWEGVTAVLFWLAWWAYRGHGKGATVVRSAFTAGLSLWLAFAIADELCMAYAVEGTHLRLFTAQLVTLLAVELLPEGDSSPSGPH